MTQVLLGSDLVLNSSSIMKLPFRITAPSIPQLTRL